MMIKNNKNRTNIIDLFFTNSYRMQNEIIDQGIEIDNLQDEKQTDTILKQFDRDLIQQSKDMADCYQILYCFENDLRITINEVMCEKYGNNWWIRDKIVRDNVKDEVKSKKEKEMDSIFFSRSDPIYFTTLSQLGELVSDNFSDFKDLYRSKRFVTSLLFQINRLRINIAHNHPLAKADIGMLKDHIERWYTIE